MAQPGKDAIVNYISSILTLSRSDKWSGGLGNGLSVLCSRTRGLDEANLTHGYMIKELYIVPGQGIE